MKHPERNNRKYAWTHKEDALLQEAVELTGSKDKKLWVYLKTVGVNRSYKAVVNRLRYITAKNYSIVNIPKGWGVY